MGRSLRERGGATPPRYSPSCLRGSRLYIKINGTWCYLYRAIDREDNLVDAYLSETRDLAAAKAFFRSAKSVTQVEPDRVTTDGCGSASKSGHPLFRNYGVDMVEDFSSNGGPRRAPIGVGRGPLGEPKHQRNQGRAGQCDVA